MGPRPDGRGRLHRLLTAPPTVAELQWGRGRMAAEGPEITQVSGRRDASMGPRPDGRGRLVADHSIMCKSKLQWGRGRMAAEGDRPDRIREANPCASMGPRPDGRGRGRVSKEWFEARARLQWGRGRMAAEGHALIDLAAAPPALQWGRGRMAAEGKGDEKKVERAVELQWGRGRMAAEGRGGGATACSGSRASMGPRPDGRGRGRGIPPSPSHPRASMGPRPDGRGRPIQQVIADAENELQWGRGRMAAEGWAFILGAASFHLLQWGRGRMAAEGGGWWRSGALG